MKLKDITQYLESIAPLRFQENYDNSGLIVGQSDMQISSALISLDATEEVIEEAITKGCNLVISHHPIVFRGIKKFSENNYVHRAIIKAIKHDVALYAIHTNLDNVLRYGVNEKLAHKLKLNHVEVLKPHPSSKMETDYEVGAGALGSLPTSMSSMTFINHVKNSLGIKQVRHTKALNQNIDRVAVCGGVGSFLLPSAKGAEAQAFVTADYKYHEFFDADDRILIVDVGHYESEYYTIELIHELLSKKFANFAAHYTKVITNPVFYS